MTQFATCFGFGILPPVGHLRTKMEYWNWNRPNNTLVQVNNKCNETEREVAINKHVRFKNVKIYSYN
jgi:hypothetical protein